MDKCRTCKFWKHRDDAGPDYMVCRHDKIADDADTTTDGLAYSSAEMQWYMTGPDFGCVHHEPKEDI